MIVSGGVFVLVKFLYFGDVFNKAFIPLAIVGYETIIANSYPTHAHGIIVNYLPLIYLDVQPVLSL